VSPLTPRSKLVAYTVLAVALHGLGALATGSRPFFRLMIGGAWRVFGGSLARHHVFADVQSYFEHASRILGGSIPYRDFLIEYPPGAVPIFVLPRLVATDFGAYQVAFALEMLLADAAAVYLVACRVAHREGIERVPRRLGWYSLFILALGPLPIARFDLVPTALGFAAALGWFSGRETLGGVVAGVGALVKVFPAAILAPALVSRRPGTARGRGLLAFALTVAVGVGVWLGIGGPRVRDSLDYQFGRGLEIGSVASGLLIVLAKLTGAGVARDFNHSSEQLLAPGASWAATLALPLQGAALLLVMVRSRRTGSEDGLRFAGAAVFAMIVTGKVLSPQYLIWLIPFMAVLEGRTGWWARRVFLACCLVTFAVFPWGWMGLIRFEPLAVGLLNVRNGLLLVLWGLLLFGPRDGESKAP
jgi:hypothetical protein